MAEDYDGVREDMNLLKTEMGLPGPRMLYRLLDAEGKEVEIVDVEGNQVEPTESDVVMPGVAELFWQVFQGKKHTAQPHGRGPGLTTTNVLLALGWAMAETCRILFVREYLASVPESLIAALSKTIRSDDRLREFFEIQRDKIIGKNGSTIIFKGVRSHNMDSLRSYDDLKYCIADECQSLSMDSIETIIFTVRSPGARFLWSYNPYKATDPVHVMFGDGERADTSVPKKPYTMFGNPLVAQTLLDEAEVLRKRDPERFQHVVMGYPATYSKTRIFDFIVKEIDIADVIEKRIAAVTVGYRGTIQDRRERRGRQVAKIRNGYNVGVDFGFVDPFTIVLTYFDSNMGRLFILEEYYQTGLDPDGMLKALQEFPLPTPKWPIYADHRPELIGYLWKHKMNISRATKLNVKERVDAMKRFDIFINPHCVHAIEEYGLYSWERDNQGVVIGDLPEDANNHIIDAVAYSLGKQLDIEKPKGEYRKMADPYL